MGWMTGSLDASANLPLVTCKAGLGFAPKCLMTFDPWDKIAIGRLEWCSLSLSVRN